MKQKRFTVEQIVAVLKQAEAGVPLAELIRRVGISEQTLRIARAKQRVLGSVSNSFRRLRKPSLAEVTFFSYLTGTNLCTLSPLKTSPV